MGPEHAGSAGIGDVLFDRRIVQVRGRLDDGAAAEITARLMALDALGDEPITMIVDCADATLDAALAVADTIDLLGVPVHATCIGRCEGPAVAVLAAAEHREASPNARIRLREPRIERGAGHMRDVGSWLEAERERMRRFVLRLAQDVGRRIGDVQEDLEARRAFDAEQAVEYGLIDEVRVRGPRQE